jgi:acetyl esterase/lipase
MTPLLLSLALVLPAEIDKPKKELLWPKGAPGAVGDTAKDKPTLTTYLPAKGKATGTGVVVCPGGGYAGHALDHEGKQIAEWLTKRGVAAFVLEYRLGKRYHHPAPLQDAQRAIRLVRSRARDLGLDPKRIGIWGFSAGGHLASTAATKFDSGKADADDPIDRVSCRPDFAILCYPVITLEKPHAHWGSRVNLLGDKPDDKLVQSLCNHKQVTKDTPPVFLFHTKEDKAVPVENSELFADACKKAGVPVRLVIYDKGPHGVGLGYGRPEVAGWPTKLEEWMKERKLLPAPPVPQRRRLPQPARTSGFND